MACKSYSLRGKLCKQICGTFTEAFSIQAPVKHINTGKK
jgi:hypothetical protein